MGMKVAIPQWEGRVSPVLDVASRLVICERTERGDVIREDVLLTNPGPSARVEALRALGVEEVICGTVSRFLHRALLAAGIVVRAHVCGSVDDILQARLDGGLAGRDFTMPGCRLVERHHEHHRHGRHRQP